MLSHARAFTLGVASATSLLLGGCDSTSAPTRPRVAGVGADLLAAPSTATQVVIGTGDPAIDVRAVQAAVDAGDTVILRGHFSFDRPPTVVVPLPGYPLATVLVSKAVTIVGEGAGDERDDGDMTTIEAGSIPFFVNAPTAQVMIQRLRFVRPISDAVLVYAASGVTIASNRVDGVAPFQKAGEAFGINTSGNPPTPTAPGTPEKVSGIIRVVDNDIDAVGASAGDNSEGIVVFSVGVPGAEVEAHVSGNTVRNVTEPAINVRHIAGRAFIERNTIETGALVGSAGRNHAIRVANIGSYRIAHNTINCQWANAEAAGIGVFSQFKAWPIEGAVIVGNHVTMSAPEGTVFTDFSAGIAVYGFAGGNVVRHNSIRGRARAGLSIPVFPLPPQAPAVPADNAFIGNRFVDFTPSLADIFVGAHALRTRVEGPGTVVDLGDGTIFGR
jgi:hypothetical protein